MWAFGRRRSMVARGEKSSQISVVSFTFGRKRGKAKVEIRKAKEKARRTDGAAIPPLRDPTRLKGGAKEKSGRSGRDDKIGKGTPKTQVQNRYLGHPGTALQRDGDTLWGE